MRGPHANSAPRPAGGRTRPGPRLPPARAGIRLALWLLILQALPVRGAAAHRHAVLILAPGLTAEALLTAASAPEWQRLRSQCAFGAANAVSAPPLSAASGALTLGAGRRVSASRPFPPVSVPPGPYRADPPAGSRLAIAPVLDPDSRKVVGALGEACRAAGKRAGYLCASLGDRAVRGDGYLAAMDRSGRVPLVVGIPARAAGAPEQRWSAAARTILDRDPAELLVIELPPGSDAGAALRLTASLASELDPVRDLVLVTSVDPGRPELGGWSGLAPVLLWNARWEARAISSASTRTRGLIANIDVAPTLLEHLGVPVPREMQGHAARPAGAGSVAGSLRYVRGVHAAHEASVPVLIGWGVLAFACFLLAVTALLSRAPGRGVPAARLALVGAASFIPAMLAAGATLCASPLELTARTVALALLFTALAWSGRGRIAPLVTLYWLIILGVLADLFTGSHLLQRCLLGDYAYTGARYYGIGNEFEGLLLGTSILAPLGAAAAAPGAPASAAGAATKEAPALRRAGKRAAPGRAEAVPSTRLLAAAAVLWAVTLFAVASPGRGADFGGAVSLGVGYAVGAAGLWSLHTRRRLRAHDLVFAGLAVLLAVVGMVAADLHRPAGHRSHVGDLAARVLSEGWGPLAEIVARKVALNVSMILSPYCLVSLACVLPVVYIGYHKLDPAPRSILARDPVLRTGLIAALWGALAGLLANDSGIVAWAFATGAALLLSLDRMLNTRALEADPAGAAPGS